MVLNPKQAAAFAANAKDSIGYILNVSKYIFNLTT